MMAFEKIALTLIIIGAINWGLIGLMQFDLVATLFGGGTQAGGLARIIYVLVGISGLLSLTLFFKNSDEASNS
ncbi:hypothetical protein SAMN05421734_10974 [Pelagirhabdus alkalitolerans]|uniref:DUF378 domain-containing protein n=1 Tax=Pelagirhabdus alkalitolerans TaxID=1612202 RepID=A0A1G6LUJ9_9BACI|nr:DUF378 domain-containing protein [Pelagirhabdus alkalitolerans]SDC46942.1 hypothetical protein SAMN05421734_10974 [Pelagirhabdus alkalitolerans]